LSVETRTPDFDLPAIDPAQIRVTVDSLKGKTSVLVFGELYHELTLEALQDLASLRQQMARVKDESDWNVLLIVAQDVSAEQLHEEKVKKNISATILHDKNREIFGRYGVIVLPSFVVVDAKGMIVTTLSGYPLNFSDFIRDALLYSRGQMTRQQFETTSRDSAASIAPPDEQQLKVERQAGLARQLFRRGYVEVALEKFEQVYQLDNHYLPARIGMTRCLVKLGRIVEAEVILKDMLRKDPKLSEASRIMAWIEILRGGEELNSALRRLDMILTLNHNDAEAHYLKGRIYEAQGNIEQAMTEYKTVSELLMELKLP
jgi:pentatricopeptide repeat protein